MIIEQGIEAGGHVVGEVSTMVLLPRIVDAVAPALVLAAGGIADARGLLRHLQSDKARADDYRAFCVLFTNPCANAAAVRN